MNTNRTPHALLVSSLLSLGAVACDGGSASMTVEDGVVTESYEVITADGLHPVRVELRYDAARLAEIAHAGVVVVPRTSAPRRGIDLSGPTARPQHARRIDLTQDLRHVVAPAVPPRERYFAGCGERVPDGMQARLPEGLELDYEVRLLAAGAPQPGPGPDRRLERAGRR